MIKDKSIIIKNIYYMLTYAFTILKQSNYEEISSEKFEHIHDLFAAILSKGVTQQLKQGLYKEYVTLNEDFSTLKGKLILQESINLRLQKKQLLSCEFDEFSENNILNRILKTTMILLIKQPLVSLKYKTELKKSLLYFSNVEEIGVNAIKWDCLVYRKNNQNYKMLINVCYFVIKGLLFSDEQGKYKVASFLDEKRMHALYERFILEYYRYHYKDIIDATSPQITWKVDDGILDFLPTMQTDIMLKCNNKTLIIDAKYYGKILNSNYYNSTSFHSNNLYQIFTYVKNYDAPGTVAGMLLYAKTDESLPGNKHYMMSGNRISVCTLNLNCEFKDISMQLDNIVKEYFDL